MEGEGADRVGEGFLYSKAIGRGERNLSTSEGSVVGSGDDAVEFTGFGKFRLGKEALLHGERDNEQNKQDKAGDARSGHLNGWRRMGATEPFASISHRETTKCDNLTSTQGLSGASNLAFVVHKKDISISDANCIVSERSDLGL